MNIQQWKKEPDWLQKKRQLATVLRDRFPPLVGQQRWLKTSQKGAGASGWLNLHHGYHALPLAEAVNTYSELLQENLMEKALPWQDNQLNATHLSRIDGGQFIYIPDGYQSTRPIRFAPAIQLTNPHNVIIVGAHSQVVIEDCTSLLATGPVMMGTEILLGAGAKFTYRQAVHYPQQPVYQALHAYQAHGSKLTINQLVATNSMVETSLYSFLDGNDTHWDVTSLLRVAGTGHQALHPVADGFGRATAGKLQLVTQAESQQQIQVDKLRAGSGEPLALREQRTPLAVTEDITRILPTDSWLVQNNFG